MRARVRSAGRACASNTSAGNDIKSACTRGGGWALPPFVMARRSENAHREPCGANAALSGSTGGRAPARSPALHAPAATCRAADGRGGGGVH